jgi:cellulose synthase/poly-beta-1,6-N-acetylglucosamine synthase-like glycosyltransferase
MPHLVSWAYALLAFRLNMLLIGHTTLWGSNMAITQVQWRAVRTNVHLRNDIHEDLDLTMHLHDAGYHITYDRGITTDAHMRRVRTDRDQLWEYLQWWPRTLRLHHKWTWPVCWFFGAFMLYIATYILVVAEWLARRAGKQPLPD